jgi:hypothetical protein
VYSCSQWLGWQAPCCQLLWRQGAPCSRHGYWDFFAKVFLQKGHAANCWGGRLVFPYLELMINTFVKGETTCSLGPKNLQFFMAVQWNLKDMMAQVEAHEAIPRLK